MKKLTQKLKVESPLNRRRFLTYSGQVLTGAAIYTAFPSILTASVPKKYTEHITILHTNDVHSRIDPFPDNDKKFPAQGGIAKRATLIKQFIKENPNTLLLDCGDILQGTPYFNFYNGELEFKLMDELGYHASTIGNHDFDCGIERLSELINTSQFSMINANYNFKDTPLQDLIKPYQIFEIGKVKIGVMGVGVELNGLVPQKLYGNTQYLNPIKKANYYANLLKNELNCDLVIVLSHLGYKYESNKVSDIILAQQSTNIDVILGGHTHTFMDVPDVVKNVKNKPVIINQVGWAGIYLGKLDFYFTQTKHEKQLVSDTIPIL